MKRIIYMVLSLLPFIGNAQQYWYKSSPLDYMWKNVGNAGFSPWQAAFTSLAFSPSGQPYIGYADAGSSFTYKASVMKFDGTNWVYVGNADFSVTEADFTSLAFSESGQPYIAFSDWQTDTGQATVMKFDGISWVNVGSPCFSAGRAEGIDLAFNPIDGQPYVAYKDGGHSSKATVMKFDGTNWVNIGTAGFSAGEVDYTSLAFSTSSEPYVAFPDKANSWKATVMKFDGTNWVYVGNAGFSAGETLWTSLAFSSSNNQPYVAYDDYQFPPYGRATVMKFDGTDWLNVGTAGFSADQAWFTSLAFSPLGEPYVAYEDWGNSQKATVMKFDGTSWVYVGNAGFSTGEAQGTSLAFSPSGIPYVAFEDFGNSLKATVIKYDSVFVGINEIKDSQLSLYPNPASKSLTIEVKKFPGDLNHIEIGDIKGIQMFSTVTTNSKIVVDVGNYPNGMYFVNFKSATSNYTGKFCKD